MHVAITAQSRSTLCLRIFVFTVIKAYDWHFFLCVQFLGRRRKKYLRPTVLFSSYLFQRLSSLSSIENLFSLGKMSAPNFVALENFSLRLRGGKYGAETVKKKVS